MSGNHTPNIQASDLKAIVESLLFVASEPMSIKQIGRTIEGAALSEIEAAIRSIQEECDRLGRGIQCVEVAGGFSFTTQPDCGPWVKRLVAGKPKLSRSGLEVLAIVAYKQPITRPEIEAVRGVDTGGVMRTLLERRLVRILGRREGVGRPVIYGTTNDFLKIFGLNNLKDLPPLQELPQPALVPQHRQPQQQVVNFDQ